MKIKSISAISLVCFGLLFNGCEQEKFFELTNPVEFPWLNIAEFERAAVSPYNLSFYQEWGGAFYFVDMVIRDALTDMVYHIPSSSADYPYIEVYTRQTGVSHSRVQWSFEAGYKSIMLINSALDFYYKNNENPFPNALAADKENNLKRIVGELHFMRAFAYFYMAVRHCPLPGDPGFDTEKILPLRENLADAEGVLNPVYVTAKEIYDFVIKDLDASVALLPEKYEQGIHHPSYQIGRANRFTAKAFKARVLFRLRDFDQTLALVSEVIDNKAMYSLQQDPIEAFNRSDASQGDEVIWQAIFYDKTHNQSAKDITLFTFLDYRAANGGHGEFFRRSTWHTYSMSNDVVKRIGWMDEDLNETDEARFDKRYQQLYHRLEGNRGRLGDNPEIYEQQYTDVKEPRVWGDKYFRAPDGQYSNLPVIRLAELYLTRAAILFRMNDMQGAADDLNVIRERAWDAEASGIEYEDSDAYLTSSNITEPILHNERLKELAFEGDWLMYCQAMELPILPGDRPGAAEVLPPYSSMFWPIPQRELDFRVD